MYDNKSETEHMPYQSGEVEGKAVFFIKRHLQYLFGTKVFFIETFLMNYFEQLFYSRSFESCFSRRREATFPFYFKAEILNHAHISVL